MEEVCLSHWLRGKNLEWISVRYTQVSLPLVIYVLFKIFYFFLSPALYHTVFDQDDGSMGLMFFNNVNKQEKKRYPAKLNDKSRD